MTAPPSALALYAMALEDMPPAWTPPTCHAMGAVEVQVRAPMLGSGRKSGVQVRFLPAPPDDFLAHFPAACLDWLDGWWFVPGESAARRVQNWIDGYAVRLAERQRIARDLERAARVRSDSWE